MAAEAKYAQLESHAIKIERTIKLLDQQVRNQQNTPHPASLKKTRVTQAARSSRAKIPQATGEETTEHDMEVLEENLGDGRVNSSLLVLTITNVSH